MLNLIKIKFIFNFIFLWFYLNFIQKIYKIYIIFKYLWVCGYLRVPAGFKKICRYFLNMYPQGKWTGSEWIFFLTSRITDKHYPCLTRSVAISNCAWRNFHIYIYIYIYIYICILNKIMGTCTIFLPFFVRVIEKVDNLTLIELYWLVILNYLSN